MSTREYSRLYRLAHPGCDDAYRARRKAKRDAARAERQNEVAKCPYCGREYHPWDNHGNKRHPTCGSAECKHARVVALTRNAWRSRHWHIEKPKKPRVIVKPEMKKCVVCGKLFQPRERRVVCCSAECTHIRHDEWNRAYNRRHRQAVHYGPKACLFCGKEFTPQTIRSRFCSEGCARRYNYYKCPEKEIVRKPVATMAAAMPKRQNVFAAALAAMDQVERDMMLPAAERYEAQKRWTATQRKYAQKIYMKQHGLFHGTYYP